MAERIKLEDEEEPVDDGGLYFPPSTNVTFFSTGCTLLDCALGGGWGNRHVINIVGDRSTGKSLLAIEGAANFVRKFPDGKIEYADGEAVFDKAYAENQGLPIDSVNFVEDAHGNCTIATVEDLVEDLEGRVLKEKRDHPTLYIVDSMDSISDRAELARAIDKETFGANKPKVLSQMFRRNIGKMKERNVTLMIISQVRDNIGVTFGEKHTRSGGKALDFYSAQVLWLAQTGQIKKTKKGIERPIGVNIRAKVKKNKCGLPFRQADFPIYFSYGIEDVIAGVKFLEAAKQLDSIGIASAEKYIDGLAKLSDEDYAQERKNVSDAVRQAWQDIEEAFKPKRRKYG